MEEPKFKVFSMLADTVVFTGTKSECENHVFKNSSIDDTLYILKA